MRTFVSQQGWVLVGEYSDVASGKDDRRAGFVAARLDRIARRAHTLSELLEEGVSLRVYAAMAQKERELIAEQMRAALAAARARCAVLAGIGVTSRLRGPTPLQLP